MDRLYNCSYKVRSFFSSSFFFLFIRKRKKNTIFAFSILCVSVLIFATSAQADLPTSFKTASQSATRPATQPATQPATRPNSLPAVDPYLQIPSKDRSLSKVIEKRLSERFEDDDKEIVDILFSTDIYGRFAWPGCPREGKDKANIAHLHAAVRHFRDLRLQKGELDPIVLLGGSSLRPDIMGSFLFNDAPTLSEQFVLFLKSMRVDALALGLFDFGAHPKTFDRYIALNEKHGVSLLAGNVDCVSEHCISLKAQRLPYKIIRRGRFRIAIYSVIRNDLKKRILSQSAKRLKVSAAVSWSKSLLKKLKEEEKVDLIIALANLNLENEAPKGVLDYVRSLGDLAPDIVISDGMFQRNIKKGFIGYLRYGDSLIVGTDRFGQNLGQIELSTRSKKDKVLKIDNIRFYKTVNYIPEKRHSLAVEGFCQALSSAVNQPIGHGFFKKPADYSEFLHYVMQIMRQRTHAEIAIINESGIADTSFPMRGELSWEKVLRAIRTDSAVGFVDLTGSRLIKIFSSFSKNKTRLRLLGLKKIGKKWKVNGRSINKEHSYRVALTSFIANGGDGLIKLTTLERFRSLEISLRDLITDYFGSDGQKERDHDDDVSLEKDFPDLRKKWLLYGDLRLGFGLSSVNVNNGVDRKRYSLPLLRRDDLVALSGNLDLAFGATTRMHLFEFDLSLNYGKTWTTQTHMDEFGNYSDDTTSAESLDRISSNILYRLSALRVLYGKQWYIPEFYSELRLISEFTGSGVCDPVDCPNSGDQSYHYMELGLTTGLGWKLHPLFFIKIGAALRNELLTPNAAKPDIPATPGIYVGYLLRRIKLINEPAHPLFLESRMDFYFTDLAGELRRELTTQTKVYFSLTRRLSLTLTHQLYLYDKQCQSGDIECQARGDSLAIANDISFGLAYFMDFRRQTF